MRKEVHLALSADSPARVIAVVGPTGVGKTALLRQIMKDVLKEHEANAPASEVPVEPVVAMLCPDPSTHGGYDFKRGHWEEMAKATGDPFVDVHFDPVAAAKRRSEGVSRIASVRRPTGYDLRSAVYKHFALHRTRILLLDEAQHMAGVTCERQLSERMDAIKAFGIKTGVKQILFGTEALLPLLRLNGQLSRRTYEVFFDAYNYRHKADRDAFRAALLHLIRALPCAREDVFRRNFDEFFSESGGCVGVLKEWLMFALAHAVSQKEDLPVSYRHVKKGRLNPGRLNSIYEGLITFREYIHDESTAVKEDIFRASLGLPPRVRGSEKESEQKIGAAEQRRKKVLPEGVVEPAFSGSKPGKRNPKRDSAFGAIEAFNDFSGSEDSEDPEEGGR